MRTGTLTRTRIFRADPALDAALEASAARAGVNVSAFMRRALASVVRPDEPPPAPSATSTALQVAA
ncbi:ribbon-helix-helix protein, CopG family [Methylobacterium sp. E-046]|uniref:ribbon-helix-helix protein, CopG family n=1 Tax=Methylobacterium sp. E-046 TaxID=2836576 RepID=UPI00391AF305